jgi:hypothetical protein
MGTITSSSLSINLQKISVNLYRRSFILFICNILHFSPLYFYFFRLSHLSFIICTYLSFFLNFLLKKYWDGNPHGIILILFIFIKIKRNAENVRRYKHVLHHLHIFIFIINFFSIPTSIFYSNTHSSNMNLCFIFPQSFNKLLIPKILLKTKN